MKLVFNNKDTGMTLAYVECTSTEEADVFLNWFESKTNQPTNVTPATIVDAEVVDHAPTEPVQAKPKVERSVVGQAAIALVQLKSRKALEPIFEKYGVKRVGELAENDLADAFADIQSALGAA